MVFVAFVATSLLGDKITYIPKMAKQIYRKDQTSNIIDLSL